MSAEFDSHEGRSLEEIVDSLAKALRLSPLATAQVKELLIEFAEEIKRQAIEP